MIKTLGMTDGVIASHSRQRMCILFNTRWRHTN